jgi:hypothetical protein
VQALLVEAPTAILDCDALIKATFNDRSCEWDARTIV